MWPYFERLGARIPSDFEIVYPVGADATPGRDEALRLARYEHWQATRGGALAGVSMTRRSRSIAQRMLRQTRTGQLDEDRLLPGEAQARHPRFARLEDGWWRTLRTAPEGFGGGRPGVCVLNGSDARNRSARS